MNIKRSWLAVPIATLLAVTMVGCSSGSNSSKDAGDGKGIITTNGNEPQHPLIPANTIEVGGGNVLDIAGSGLVYYDANGKTQNEFAESITSNDNQLWTIKIQPGHKFSDGTEIKAQNFVGAWKQAAKEGFLSTEIYAPIEGAADDGTGDLTGLNIVDDYTFTAKLKFPSILFPDTLGYTSFYPLPDSVIADPAAITDTPVSSGPYKVDKWEHNVSINLVPNPNYEGPRKAKNGGVNFVFYTDLDAAYTDLQSDKLDILQMMPSSAMNSFQTQLGDRAINQTVAGYQGIIIPSGLDHFKQGTEEGKLRRQAISMSIDRKQIIDKIFAGTRTPANDFTSPALGDYNKQIAGNDVTTYNPEKAKELWAQADAISPFTDGQGKNEKFTISYNVDGGNQEWVQAVTNSIKNTLGIESEGNPYPDFKSFRDDAENRKIAGALRGGWQGDYPNRYNFLASSYKTGGGSNDGDYSSSEFDSLLDKALSQTNEADFASNINKAEQVLYKDLPSIPLWYQSIPGGYSKLVNGVTFNWKGVPIYSDITKNS